MRIRNFSAVLLLMLAMFLAACGGNADNSAINQLTPVLDDTATADLSFDMDAPLTEADKEAAWISGWYVATAGADYVNGVDYLFQLLTDGNGHYKWVLRLTNNSWQPKTIHYGWQRYQYDFRIKRNGVLLWQAFPFNDFIAQYPDETIHPYQTLEYTKNWNGRDLRGRRIHGLVNAIALHFEESHRVRMHGPAWLN